VKALILWAEPQSKNLGVRVLAEGSRALLGKAFGDVEVEFQGFGAGDAPVRIGTPRGQLRRLVSRQNDELVDWVRTFDLVVDTRAGDSFADIYGQRRLFVMTLMAEIVAKAGAPLILGPQTIGPFTTRRGRTMARRSLKAAHVVMARDPESAGQSDRVGRPVDITTTDVVFALEPVVPSGHRDVLINPSGLLWGKNEHVNSADYQALIRGVCTALLLQGRRVSLIAHVLESPLLDNDVPVVQSLGRELGEQVEVLVPADLADVRAMLASAEVVVGSRMHACLNALSVGRPAIPLAYSRKFDPLLRHIGWNNTVDLRTDADPVSAVLRALEAPDLTTRVGAVSDRAQELLAGAGSMLSPVLG